MRKKEELMEMPYMLKIEFDMTTGRYIAYYPELPGCLAEGDTMMEARGRAEAKKEEWLENALEQGVEIRDACYREIWETSVRVGLSRKRHDELSRQARMRNMSLSAYCSRLLEEGL